MDGVSAPKFGDRITPRKMYPNTFGLEIETTPSAKGGSSTTSRPYSSSRYSRTAQWGRGRHNLQERMPLKPSDSYQVLSRNSPRAVRFETEVKIPKNKSLEKEVEAAVSAHYSPVEVNQSREEPVTTVASLRGSKTVNQANNVVDVNDVTNNVNDGERSENRKETETKQNFRLQNEFVDQNGVEPSAKEDVELQSVEESSEEQGDANESNNDNVEINVSKIIENEKIVSESLPPKKSKNEIYFGEEVVEGAPAAYLFNQGDELEERRTTLMRPEGLKFVLKNENADGSGGGDVETTTHNKSALSQVEAHRLEMSTEFFIVPSPRTPKATLRTTTRPSGVIFASRTTAPPHSSSRSSIRNEPWAVPILVFACGFMGLMGIFETFVLIKAYQTTPSRRHLFLGQMLLLGLFSCCGLAALLTTNPTPMSCGVIRFGAGFAFTLVFAALLVKCVFLISMNGGVYLPATYQALLLMFAVLIQVAIGTQWLITAPPTVENVVVPMSGSTVISSRFHLLLTAGDLASMSPTIQLCDTRYPDLLFSLIYVIFLIAFVSVLAVKSRGIRDNYREATYIGLAIVGALPIWLGWTLCGFTVADRHKDACLAFGLVSTATIVFLVMFMPKGRQLAAMGKEGLYVEDREERFGTLSRTGSGYSPSFFHFKPLKHGRGGLGYSHSIVSESNMGAVSSKNHGAATMREGGKLVIQYLNVMHRCTAF